MDRYNYKFLHEPLLGLPRVSSKYMSSEYATSFNPDSRMANQQLIKTYQAGFGYPADKQVKSMANLASAQYEDQRVDSAIGQKDYQGDEQVIPHRVRNQSQNPRQFAAQADEDSLAAHRASVQQAEDRKALTDTEYMYNRGARSNYGQLVPREATDFNTLQKAGEFFPTPQSVLPLPENVHLTKNPLQNRYQMHDLSRWNNKIVYDGGRIKDSPAPGLSEPERLKMMGVSAERLRMLEEEYFKLVGTRRN